MTAKMKVDLICGVDVSGWMFGFVYDDNEDDGGYFFTWRHTLAETLRTLEPCPVEGDGGLYEEDVREFLEEVLPGSGPAAEFFDAVEG